jgi:hypothetical protein
VTGVARRPGTRERGHRVQRGGAGRSGPRTEWLPAAGAARRSGAARGHRVHRGGAGAGQALAQNGGRDGQAAVE